MHQLTFYSSRSSQNRTLPEEPQARGTPGAAQGNAESLPALNVSCIFALAAKDRTRSGLRLCSYFQQEG